jgi:hypothetical protein
MSLTFSEKGHRYRLDGAPVPNVTTILNGGLPKPALVGWAARMAGEAAAQLIFGDGVEPTAVVVDRLRQMGPTAVTALCADAAQARRNAAAVKGTDVHAYAERVLHGEAVDVPSELAGYVEGYVGFLDRVELVPILTERPCASRRHWYAGRFDLLATIDDEPWLLDNKTGSGVYGETACQVAAYARADFYVDVDGAEVPMPHVAHIGALHVTEGGTDLYDLGDIDEAHREFIAARLIYSTDRRRRALVEAPVVLMGEGALF